MAENPELFERRVSRLTSMALPLQGLSFPTLPLSLSPGSLAFILCFQRLITLRRSNPGAFSLFPPLWSPQPLKLVTSPFLLLEAWLVPSLSELSWPFRTRRPPSLGGGLVAQSNPTLATPWTVAHQAPLPLRFPRPKNWSGLLFPPPGDLPDPEIEPQSPVLQADSLPPEPPSAPWSPLWMTPTSDQGLPVSLTFPEDVSLSLSPVLKSLLGEHHSFIHSLAHSRITYLFHVNSSSVNF